MSDTPRTDALSNKMPTRTMDESILIDHARTLERELSTLQAECERLREDAERYRFLRNDDNWCDDEPDTWTVLGEISHADFDALVDSKMREKYWIDNPKQEPTQ